MNGRERPLALPERAGTKKVNSETLIEYLLPFSQTAPESQFSPHLDMSLLEGYIDELYAYDIQGSVYDEDTLEQVKESILQMGINDDSLVDKLQNSVAKVERARQIYLDSRDATIGATDISAGTYASVESSCPEGFDNFELLPLMRMHTHPTNILLSPKDYVSLLVGEGEMRFFKASLVLCPDIQILALSTADTPTLDESQMQEYLNYWDATFNENITSTPDQETVRLEKVAQECQDKWIEEFKATLSEISEAEEKLKSGLLNEVQFDQLIEAREEKVRQRQLSHFKAATALSDYLESRQYLLHNQTHVALARALGMKIYTSTNRKDFYAASA